MPKKAPRARASNTKTAARRRAELHEFWAAQLPLHFHALPEPWREVPHDAGLRLPESAVLVAHPDGRIGVAMGIFKCTTMQHRNGYAVIAGGETLHRIICTTFNGAQPFKGAQVRHLDGNPSNNSAGNLAWGSAGDNAADRIAHGRQTNGKDVEAARIRRDLQWSILKGPIYPFDFGLPSRTVRYRLMAEARKRKGYPSHNPFGNFNPPPAATNPTLPGSESWPPADPGAPDWPPGQKTANL